MSTRAQVIVIDAKGHLFGRLASIVAKQLLQGQHVVRNAMRRQGRGAGCARAREGGPRACIAVVVVRISRAVVAR